MKPQYLTRMESGAIRGHLRRGLAAAQLVRQSLHPVLLGGRIDVEEAHVRCVAAAAEFQHLYIWLAAIKKGNTDGTDLTAHL